jgi:hypothetical protein
MQRLIASIKKMLPFEKNAKEFEIGRWKINYCSNIIRYNVEMANEDNCGGCGDYLNLKIKDLNTSKQNNTTQ